MNQITGLGVGTSVGLGTLIGLGFVNSGVELSEWLTTFAFYGFMSGLLFEMYRMAFTAKPPSRGGRGGGHKAPGAR